jgi:hypothetical protein
VFHGIQANHLRYIWAIGVVFSIRSMVNWIFLPKVSIVPCFKQFHKVNFAHLDTIQRNYWWIKASPWIILRSVLQECLFHSLFCFFKKSNWF